MEPNQNMENNNPFVGAPVSEQVVTEQVTEAQMGPAPMEPAALPEKKKSNGMLIGLILCLVLAAGGIGFGVFAMMDGNSRAENLNKQISELKSTNNDLMDKLSEASKDDGDTIINVDTDTDVDTEDYIYVGEWGLKIKKPENWRNLVREYSYYNDFPQAVDTLEVRESADSGDGIMISVGGESCETQVAAQYGTCFTVDGKVIIVNKLDGELTPGTESPLSETFLKNFLDEENYSAI